MEGECYYCEEITHKIIQYAIDNEIYFFCSDCLVVVKNDMIDALDEHNTMQELYYSSISI